MQQTFLKTIQGHILEFNRLLYPVRYNVFTQDVEVPGIAIVVNRDASGVWNINSLEKLPGWISEITSGIYEAIEENENSK